MGTQYVTVAQACCGCGSAVAVRVTMSPPTEESRKELAAFLGGMWCIKIRTVSVDEDEIAIIKEET